MHCQHCGNKLATDNKYCGRCGKNVPESFFSGTSGLNNETKNVNQALCEVCRRPAEVKYIELYENKGALVMRYHREIKGKLCKDCINEYFWKFTLTTLFIGWFGIISFIVTPFYLINNISRYVWIKIK
jgi:hypothetical protein